MSGASDRVRNSLTAKLIRWDSKFGSIVAVAVFGPCGVATICLTETSGDTYYVSGAFRGRLRFI